MNLFFLAREAWRIFSRHVRVRGKYFARFSGSPVLVADKIVHSLWNGRFFETSLGNYPYFYMRDFGMVFSSLVRMGYADEVRKTLLFALDTFRSQGGIATLITRGGKARNFPNVYSPDSTAYLFRCLVLLGDFSVVKKYRSFLQSELYRFCDKVVDMRSGLPKRQVHFSGMRDHSVRDASCYDATMIAVLSQAADALKLDNPLAKFDFRKVLVDTYWTGSYFKDTVVSDILSSDANVFPFWLGVIDDVSMLKKSLATLQSADFDKPFPLRYVADKSDFGKKIFISHLTPDWQSNSVWTMVGLPFIDLVRRVDRDKACKYVQQYARLIDLHGTFLEVFDVSGKPYKNYFHSCDEGMMWAALFFDLYLPSKT